MSSSEARKRGFGKLLLVNKEHQLHGIFISIKKPVEVNSKVIKYSESLSYTAIILHVGWRNPRHLYRQEGVVLKSRREGPGGLDR